MFATGSIRASVALPILLLPYGLGSAALVDYIQEFVCDAPTGYSNEDYHELMLRNCQYVEAWQDELQTVIEEELHMVFDSKENQAENQKAVWVDRSEAATVACTFANATLNSGDYVEAAYWAINAWGSIVRRGQTCCGLQGPPYCVDTERSASTVALMVPPAMVALLVLGGVVASLFKKAPKGPSALSKVEFKKEDKPLARVQDEGRTGRVLVGLVTGRSELQVFLDAELTERSCLRVLPDAKHFSTCASSVFAGLTHTYKFQEDNAKNQHQHLLSLWRSQLSMVADRQYGSNSEKVDEKDLFKEALGDLHAELLEGFLKWRKAFTANSSARMEAKDGQHTMGGAKWELLKPAVGESHVELSKQLSEIAAYLLVWGEAGNLRFMPEVLYFLTDLVLSAEPASCKELYQFSDGESDYSHVSGLFLAKVVRPIYNVIFDETYDKVDVNAANKDAKKLKDGLDAYLPADVANYDDWNEFFCDADRLAAGLSLQNGTLLFEHDHAKRFAQLVKVDWDVSLQACLTKTHGELHSLWGVFASCHRVLLIHSVLFWVSMVLVCGDPPKRADGQVPLGGETLRVRMAAVFLVVPIHAVGFVYARWKVTGPALRPNYIRCEPCVGFYRSCARAWQEPAWRWGKVKSTLRKWVYEPPLLFFLLPLLTFIVLRMPETVEDHISFDASARLDQIIYAHYVVGGAGLFYLLLVPSVHDRKFPFDQLTRVPLSSRVLRYSFWVLVFAVKFQLGLVIVQAMTDAIESLEISRPGRQSWAEIKQVYFSTRWGEGVLLWVVLWGSNFCLYLADTALWFVVMCSFLGTLTTIVQRHTAKNGDVCALGSLIWEDAIYKIPRRFSEKVLCYTNMGQDSTSRRATPFSMKFPLIWDRIVQYMNYEDDISSAQMGDLSFEVGASGRHVYWQDLSKPLEWARDGTGPSSIAGHAAAGKSRQGASILSVLQGSQGDPSSSQTSSSSPGMAQRVKVPGIFSETPYAQRCLQTYTPCVSDKSIPPNDDVQWRLLALSRGLGLPMPRPYRAPYIPGITVLIPHYGETILMQKKELFQAINKNVPLIDWLVGKYGSEFDFFTSRMQSRGDWPVVGSEWQHYTDYQWTKVANWASFRQQTLFRTVAGMCYYHPAIQAHMELQGDKSCLLAGDRVWDVSDVFTCLVSMQMYRFFDKTFLQHTNYMFDKFPKSFKVAYIDYDVRGPKGDADNVHSRQVRRYFSCLIDSSCPLDGDSLRRRPKFRIELPGFPILGDGKGDNQNHAIPFMRGHYSQGIDANQGAYFEQMMLLPCALGEFRGRSRRDGSGKQILGFPEHITSDIGSVGDFAASAEVAFGTILQRTYAVLGARMHYGHPDIMNKLFMMQQGGVSKATKTLNLSEDIFAGMDFTLRGDGRKIKHCEYFNLAKGRDLGFNTVLGFFSKLSSGTGEQVLTRQVYRLGQVLHLPEALGIFYAHAGYYLNQFLVSWATPLLVFVWALVLLSDCEGVLDAFQQCKNQQFTGAEVITGVLATCYSWLMLLFIFASSLPLFMELWMQRSLKDAVFKVFQGYLTMSPFLFIFQAKCIGHYVANEFRYGGATYVATGRGLPTERRPFIGEMKPRSEGFLKMAKVGGLYLDYARIAHYDGAMLLVGLAFVYLAGGITASTSSSLLWIFMSCGLILISWLYGPFIFNPYQFAAKNFREDGRALLSFFLESNGTHWLEWYKRTQLNVGHGLHQTLVDISFLLLFFFVVAWYVSVTFKVELLMNLFSEHDGWQRLYWTILLPPTFLSIGFCFLVVLVETLFSCSSSIHRSLESELQKRRKKRADAEKADEEKGAEQWWVKPWRRNEDVRPVEPEPKPSRFGCSFGVPLPFTAACVIAIDMFEVWYTLLDIYQVSWRNALLSGVILKLTLLSASIMLGEGVLRSDLFARIASLWAPLGLPLQTWVTAHRMARDLFTSLLIFLPLGFLVLLNSMNETLCPGFNVHHLCLYRDTGTHSRTEKVLEFDLDHNLDAAEQPQTARVPPQSAMPAPQAAAAAGAVAPAPAAAPEAGGFLSWLGGARAKPAAHEAAVLSV